MSLQSDTREFAGQSSQPPAGQQDMRGFWRILRRRVWTIVLTTALVVAAVLLLLLLIRPLYTASSHLLIDPRDRQILKTEVAPAGLGADQVLIESQVRLLTSDAIFSRVIERENLLQDNEFGQIDRTGPVARLKALLMPQASDDTMGPQARALRAMRRLVSVRRSERTYVVEIKASSRSPDKARRIADGIAAAYIADQADADTDTTRRATTSLTGRLDELRESVSRAEKAVEEYRRQNNLPMAEGRLINEQQITELNNRLVLARARTAEARAKFEQVQRAVRNGGDEGAQADAQSSVVVANLRGQLADITRREADMLQRLGPRHPSVQDIRAEVSNIRSLIAEELRRISAANRNDFEVAKANEESLERSFQRLQGQSYTSNQAQVRLRELQREAEASRSVYEAFLTRAKQTHEQERLQSPQARVIAPAITPHESSYPPRLLMLALGLIGGLGLGTALALTRDHFDDSLRSPAQLRRHTGLETLALLPKLTTRRDIIDAPATAQAQAIRGLRNELRDSNVQVRGRSLLVTSALAGEGKTTTALDLAQAIAMAGERVLLIDADMAGRGLTRRIAPKAQQGLAEVLNGNASLNDVLLKDPRSGLEALPLFLKAGNVMPRPSSGDIARLLQQTKAGFDVVVFDGPSVLGDGGARTIAESCDEVVLVVRSGKTSQGALTEALQSLRATPAKLRGTVLTGADVKAARHYGQG